MGIGFTANREKELPKTSAVMEFDSGRSIGIEDITHHLGVFGMTGTGKTMSVVLPMLRKLIISGHAGIIIDIKGTLGQRIRHLAKKYGRENDIVEFGTSTSAQKINLLKDLSAGQACDFLHNLIESYISTQNHNMEWHWAGIMNTLDCVLLLKFIGKSNPKITPNLYSVYEMIHDTDFAAGMYEYYRENIYNPANPEEEKFVRMVENDAFHIMAKKKDNRSRPDEYPMQVTWRMKVSRMALRNIADTPGLMENFSGIDAPGFDMEQCIRDNKIVIVSFARTSGISGAKLSRILLESFYDAILNGVSSKPCFVCIDEFQECADLSRRTLSDFSFISQAREFNGAFIIATQSLSALHDRYDVEGFISNFNQKLVFFTDDVYTQNLVSRYSDLRLTGLEGRQLFSITHDIVSDRRRAEIETCDNAYRKCMKDFDDFYPQKNICSREKPVSLLDLLRISGINLQNELSKDDLDKIIHECVNIPVSDLKSISGVQINLRPKLGDVIAVSRKKNNSVAVGSSPYSIAAVSSSGSVAKVFESNSIAAVSGTDGRAVSDEMLSIAASTESETHCVSKGKNSAAVTCGFHSNATVFGDSSVAVCVNSAIAKANGEGSFALSINGEARALVPDSIACSRQKASGVLGSRIILFNDKVIRSFRVDGKKYLPDIFYFLDGKGKVVSEFQNNEDEEALRRHEMVEYAVKKK